MEQPTQCKRCGQPLGPDAGALCRACQSKEAVGRDNSVRLGLLAVVLGVVLYARHQHWLDFSALFHSFLHHF